MNNYRVIWTGAMGGGKTALLSHFSQAGTTCVVEPAREILYEQRAIGADGVPEQDPKLFTMLMLSRSIRDHRQHSADQAPVIYDRGVPDMIAYAQLFGLTTSPYEKAAALYRYHEVVFYFPPWKQIYVNDDERKIDFEGAKEFGIRTRRVYEDWGYTIVDVPLVSIQERTQFLEQGLKRMFG